MKTITQILNGEKIKHKGNLTVDGNIGESAIVEIQDGSLIVNGNVGSGSKIFVSVSEQLRQSTNNFNMGGNYISIGGGSASNIVIRNGKVVSSGGVRSCNMSINGVMVGNVNIDNRIFTNDAVTDHGNGIFEINPTGSGGFSAFIFSSNQKKTAPKGTVSATVDGVLYSGNTIRIEGKKVIVNNQQMTNNNNNSSSEPSGPFTLTVHGYINDGVTITSDASIEVNNIGKNCVITSSYEGINAKSIGDGTLINVRNAIKVTDIGNNCQIVSSQYGLNANNIGNNSVVDVRDDIEINNIGNACRISSKQYGIKAYNVGLNNIIKVRDAITLRDVGSNTAITSLQYGITAKNISDKVQIDVRDAVKLKSVGNQCAVSSQQYGIDVKDNVGDNSRLQARDAIVIGSLGNNSTLTSNQDKIKVIGATGTRCQISARESVSLKDVGDYTSITSTQDEVSARNVGVGVRINAKDDIDIDGKCPDPSTLSLVTRGRVQKPTRGVWQQPVVAISKPVLPVSNSYVGMLSQINNPFNQPQNLYDGNTAQNSISKFEDDELQRAMAESLKAINNVPNNNNSNLSSVSIFAEPTVKPVAVPSVEIPRGFECPIRNEVMDDPVICLLDFHTYERKAITDWLTQKRTSPITRDKMADNQKVEDILKPNRALADSIQELKKKHPELFSDAPAFN